MQIYTPTHICTGYVYCSHQRRLLDVLNSILAGMIRTDAEFLPVSEAEIRSRDGRVMEMQSAYINTANILFVREVEDGKTRGLGGQDGHKPYPFVPKWSTVVKVYMPFYTLSGQFHYPKGRRIMDVLNSELRFLAMTNVEISPLSRKIESGISFIAVNKQQILSLEELEDNHGEASASDFEAR